MYQRTKEDVSEKLDKQIEEQQAELKVSNYKIRPLFSLIFDFFLLGNR